MLANNIFESRLGGDAALHRTFKELIKRVSNAYVKDKERLCDGLCLMSNM